MDRERLGRSPSPGSRVDAESLTRAVLALVHPGTRSAGPARPPVGLDPKRARPPPRMIVAEQKGQVAVLPLHLGASPHLR